MSYRMTTLLTIAVAMMPIAPAWAQEDIAAVPVQDLRAGGNERMRYFLIGAAAGAKAPPEGFRLLIVLPGGDGGEGFRPFVTRIWENALGADYIVAQPVAVKWTPDQKVVWPTKHLPVAGQKFATEDFVAAVIKDVAGRYRIDNRCVFTLAWSSSGPAAYAVSLSPDTPVTGSFIAMSVFKPGELPALKQGRNRPYYLLHSPDDRVCPFRMAKQAEADLRAAGAKVRLETYPGGHGWRMAVFPAIRQGVQWLVANRAPRATQPSSQPAAEVVVPPAAPQATTGTAGGRGRQQALGALSRMGQEGIMQRTAQPGCAARCAVPRS